MGKRSRPPALTPRERLLFEAGIKLGGIFHQYLGIPVTGATATGLARAIEEAVSLQPYVVGVRVRIRPGRTVRKGPRRYRYQYLTAEMLDARVSLQDGPIRVDARLAFRPDLRYPLMAIESASSPRTPRRKRSPTAPGGRRSGRR